MTRPGPDAPTSVVNSWNEWDPLEEVIVGSARGAAEIGYEPALAPYFPSGSQECEFGGRPVPDAVVDAAERQLDRFADLLDRLGVTVRRPDPIDHGISLKTPDWRRLEDTPAPVQGTFCW